MQQISIPMTEEINRMSRARCQCERTRLRNEISFARGNAMWGGPSYDGLIAALRDAVEAIDRRLCALMAAEDGQHPM